MDSYFLEIGFFDYCTLEKNAKALNIIAKALPIDGLVYIVAHYPRWLDLVPAELQLDERLTKKAKNLETQEYWDPKVFRKN